MEQLFDNWKNEIHHKNELFIYDGVIDERLWNSVDIKILFLLKEAYHSNKSIGSWDLISGHLKVNGAKTKTFKPLGQWANGVLELKKTDEIQELVNNKNILDEALKKCSVVNLKKSAGNKKSNKSDLLKYVEDDWEKYIKKQIDSLGPDIIICCGTWPLVKNKINANKVSERVYQGENIVYVDYYHPAYPVPNLMKYYGLCSIIKNSKLL